MCWASLRCKSQPGQLSSAQARRGATRTGGAWHQLRQQHWGLRLPLLLSLKSRYGLAGLGSAGRSGLRRNEVRLSRATLISARRVNRLSLLDSINPDMARQGWLRLGSAWQGPAIHGGVWQGGARTADGSTELLRRLPAVLFESRHGLVRLSADRTGWQWCGGVW
jgi:hypothetical protein